QHERLHRADRQGSLPRCGRQLARDVVRAGRRDADGAMTQRAPLATLLAAALLLAACSAPAQQQPPAGRRSNVAAPVIEMSAREVRVLPGSRAALLARTQGGEA